KLVADDIEKWGEGGLSGEHQAEMKRRVAAWSTLRQSLRNTGRSHSFNFDHRRRPETLRTAAQPASCLGRRALVAPAHGLLGMEEEAWPLGCVGRVTALIAPSHAAIKTGRFLILAPPADRGFLIDCLAAFHAAALP